MNWRKWRSPGKSAAAILCGTVFVASCAGGRGTGSHPTVVHPAASRGEEAAVGTSIRVEGTIDGCRFVLRDALGNDLHLSGGALQDLQEQLSKVLDSCLAPKPRVSGTACLSVKLLEEHVDADVAPGGAMPTDKARCVREKLASLTWPKGHRGENFEAMLVLSCPEP